MELVEIPAEQIAAIEPLWRELNAHHLDTSHFFKDHFASFSFTERCKTLLSKDGLKIFAVRKKAGLVGYCIASMDAGAGEIDSIYLQPEARGSAYGKELMESALSWLADQGCSRISISVVEGNEGVIPFYEKFGFKVRSRVLQLKKA